MKHIIYTGRWVFEDLNRFVKCELGNMVFVNRFPSLRGGCKHIDIGIIKENKSSDKVVFQSLDFIATIPFTHTDNVIVFHIDRAAVDKLINISLGEEE